MKTKIGIPIGLALVMFLGVFTAMLALGTLSPQQAHAQTAMRTISPATVMPGGTVTVTIAVANYGAFGGLTETLPEGFGYVAGSAVDADGDTVSTEVTGQNVKFDLFEVSSPFTYNVTVSGTEGSYTFSGTLRDSDRMNHNVTGANMVTVSTDTSGQPVAPDSTMVSGHCMRMVMEDGTEKTIYTPCVTNTNQGPGAASGYDFRFITGEMLTGQNTITVHFDKDFRDLPAVLSRGNITVSASVDSGSATTGSGPSTTGAYSPRSDATRAILTTGEHGLSNSAALNNVEYTFYVPDMNGDIEGAPGIAAGATVSVHVSPGAGIRNPTEGGNKGPIGVFTSLQSMMDTNLKIPVGRTLQLSDYDTNRNKSLTVIGRGFQNGTTAHIFLKNSNGDKQGLVDVEVGSDDTFTATIQVTVPPFVPGKDNEIFAEDGNQPPFKAPSDEDREDPNKRVMFEVEGLMTISPTSAAVGDEVDITLVDWPNDGKIPAGAVTIAGEPQRIIGSPSVNGGSATFRIEISTGTPSGTNEIKIDTPDLKENDTAKITVSGAELEVNPATAVPNQAITVTGRGFTDGATINAAGDDSEVSLGQNMAALDESAPGGFRNFNNGQAVTVDSGGSWSATIIVPITSVTTTPGKHPLTVLGSENREGSVDITIPARTLTIEPAEARPGESVTLTGTGFPASNTRAKEQNTPSIQIYYGGDNLVGTSIPDADGNITLNFRVPLDAAIPSTNRVEARFMIPGSAAGAPPRRTHTNHEVPGARISLSMDEGKPGDKVTLSGDGFKAFASIGGSNVAGVEIGGIDVTPAPRPATDRNGEFTTTILVPDLSPGTNAIKVQVSDVTASANFKVLDVSVSTTMMMMEAEDATPADAFADLIAEDNLVRVYHFNKHEQTDPDTGGWSLYDTREAFMSLNSIEMIEAGEFYWLMVNNEQLNVMLGSERVDLVAGWNQIRW